MRILFAISVVCFAVLVWIALSVTRGLQSSRFGGRPLANSAAAQTLFAAARARAGKFRNDSPNGRHSSLHHSRTRKDTR